MTGSTSRTVQAAMRLGVTWQLEAACAVAVADPDHPAEASWWDVGTRGRRAASAVAVCDTCPVADVCAETAQRLADLDRSRGATDELGIWAGRGRADRDRTRKARRNQAA